MLGLALKAMDAFNHIKHKSNPLPVLYFHRVMPEPDPFCPDDWTANTFEKLVTGLNKYFSILSLDNAMSLLNSGALPANALCLSFDDGYTDNFEYAAPILQKVGAKGCFFVASEGTARGYLWNDKLAFTLKKTQQKTLTFNDCAYDLTSLEKRANAYHALVAIIKIKKNDERNKALVDIEEQLGAYTPPRCMMTDKQLITLQEQGHTIGAHTVTHSILAYQPDPIAKREIADSISDLNKFLPTPVNFFAYPNGWYGKDFTAKHENMLKQTSVEYGLATNDGGITTETPRTCLPRFMPYRKDFNQFCISIKKIAGETVSE